MTKELLVFVPGLSARAPAKFTGRLVLNLKNYAVTRGEAFVGGGSEDSAAATPEGAAGGAVTFEHTPSSPAGATSQIVLREVVWGDVPMRLTELSGKDKFLQGLRLLGWAVASLLSAPAVLGANKYQWACMLGALLVLFFWYIGIIAAVPTAIDYAILPDWAGEWLREASGAAAEYIESLSLGGLQIWVVTSFIMGFLPVTAVVDAAYAMKQYVRDGQIDGRPGLVGEEARVRIANALNEIRKEQEADGPIYTRITFLAHSFGAVPTIETLAVYRADLRAPVRLITLGAPIAFAGALRPEVVRAARSFMETGEAPGGISLDSWRCIWTRWDYLSSDPTRVGPAGGPAWPGFSSQRLSGSWSPALLRDHGRYFDDDPVAGAILERGTSAAGGLP
jgi:hypothetical protein